MRFPPSSFRERHTCNAFFPVSSAVSWLLASWQSRSCLRRHSPRFPAAPTPSGRPVAATARLTAPTPSERPATTTATLGARIHSATPVGATALSIGETPSGSFATTVGIPGEPTLSGRPAGATAHRAGRTVSAPCGADDLRPGPSARASCQPLTVRTGTILATFPTSPAATIGSTT